MPSPRQDALLAVSDLTPAERFPWPTPDAHAREGSSHGILAAMTWPGLTPAERAAAVFVGDGMGGTPASVARLARALEVSEAEALDLLWALLRKGFLARVARWWA